MSLNPTVSEVEDLLVYNRSRVELEGTSFFLARKVGSEEKLLGVQGPVTDLEGAQPGPGGSHLYPLTSGNALALRRRFPWLAPTPLGLMTSAGFGDRLGMATPGHIRALRQVPQGQERIAPIFAQQSVRENTRTGRSPQQVVDDATWGLLQEGWNSPWGADADHLKTPSVTGDFVEAGYTFFTIDPGDWVDDAAESAAQVDLADRIESLPWDTLEDSQGDLEARYLDSSFAVEGPAQMFDREILWRAAAKYGAAVSHTVAMYRHLLGAMGSRSFDLEVSVDETSTTTSVAEHFYIVSELRRLGVQWVSLAPRFVGSFEKGVDYIGDLDRFAGEFAQHAALAKELGPYKISLHSGSDKFSIYGIAADLAGSRSGQAQGPLIHLKTAGTSYLEALRTVAEVDSPLFREILTFSRGCYEADRATYHVSGQLDKVPALAALGDLALPGLLDDFDARQVLHVTFGSALDRFGAQLKSVLGSHEETHYDFLQAHFVRHLAPFVG